MNPTPHIIESALLLLAAFLIGCVAGYFLRKVLAKPASPANSELETKPATAAKPVAVGTTGGATVSSAAPAVGEGKPARKSAATRPKATPKPKAATTPKPVAARKAVKKTKASVAKAAKPIATDDPVLLDAPRNGIADDLKKIKGIGPKLEVLLNQNGVYHYDQIAAWNAKAVAIMDEKLSFKGRIQREDWVKQAKALK